MLAGNPEDGALKCLFEHFTSDESEDNRIAMVDRLRGNILSMDGHLKWRVIDLFGTEPLILLIRMVHPKLPASEQLQAAIEFYQIPECDLALHNGFKVRNLFPGPHSMFQDEDFRKSVRRVAKVFKLTNMHMERVLAGIKTVSPGKHPNVERLTDHGFRIFGPRDWANYFGVGGWVGGRDRQGSITMSSESWQQVTCPSSALRTHRQEECVQLQHVQQNN